MSLTPALDQKAYQNKINKIKLCGSNMGPHDYIPTAWKRTETAEHVTHLLCRTCLQRINVSMIYDLFDEVR